MASRVGLGPVFAFEWRMTSRRWQGYAMRSLTVLLLLGAMTLISLDSAVSSAATIAQLAEVGRSFFAATAMVLLGLVGLAAPAATAGAICQDKARGNLTLLFATDLSDPEIVLGKLAARLVPVLGLVLCAAPVLAIATLFGGVDPLGVVGALFVVLACGIFGCSLALTLSVWGTKAHEVLLATYAFGILYLLAAPIYAGLRTVIPTPSWVPWLPSFWDVFRYNPVFLVIAMVEGPPPGAAPVTIETHAAFLGLGLATSALLIGVATWRIRVVAIRQSGRSASAWSQRFGRALRRAWPSPSLDRNPVLWRECHRRGLSRWTLAVWGIYGLLCGGFSLFAIVQMVLGNRPGREIGVMVNALQVGAGLLLLGVSAPTSLAEERQQGSLDVLMATPLPTRAIVWGKWWGAFRAVLPLLILPVLVTTALARETGHFWGVTLLAALILAQGAAITSLGLALATWIARMGRAAAVTVSLYLFMALAWIPLTFTFVPGDDGIGIAAGSPPMAVGMYGAMLAGEGPTGRFASQTLWVLFWTIAYTGAAVALLLATLRTFNRCLGRIDDRSTHRLDPSRPGHRPDPRASTQVATK